MTKLSLNEYLLNKIRDPDNTPILFWQNTRFSRLSHYNRSQDKTTNKRKDSKNIAGILILTTLNVLVTFFVRFDTKI
ncbi:MAG: hypothetical protein DLM72_18640 [Candidatus Nitrosopolaris wilkensis]|nr:MAG: hypothetical protein DLM72_18640 [Candidatus Nitrosopolaris wilkensis]